MPVREIKTTIALDGEQQFKKALADATREMRVMDSELKAVTEAYRTNGDGAEYYAAKQRNLRSQIAQQEQIIKGLEQAVEDAGKTYGESSAQVDGYAIKLNNARAKMSQLEKQLSDTDREIEELGRDSIKAGRQLEQGIGDSAEEAEKDVRSLVETLQDDLSAIRSNTAFTAVSSLWNMASGAYTAVAGFTEGTIEYRKQLAFLMQNSEDAGFEDVFAEDKLVEAQGVLNDYASAMEGLNNLFQIGFDEKRFNIAMQGLLGAYAKFPETLKFESLADSLQESLATGKVTGQFAELLERLKVNIDDVNKALEESPTTEGDWDELLAYLSANELVDAYEKYRESNADLVEEMESIAKWDLQWAKLGQTAANRLVTPIRGAMADALKWINGTIEYAEENGLEAVGEKIAEDLAESALDYLEPNTSRKEREAVKAFLQGKAEAEDMALLLRERFLEMIKMPTDIAEIPLMQGVAGREVDEALAGIDLDEYYKWIDIQRKDSEPENLWETFRENGKKLYEGLYRPFLTDIAQKHLIGGDKEGRKIEALAAQAADAYFGIFEREIQVNAEEAEPVTFSGPDGGILDIDPIAPARDVNELLKELGIQLHDAEPELEEAGEEAGDAMTGGFAAAWRALDNKAYMAGASMARSYADGVSSQLGAISAAANRLSAAASSALATARAGASRAVILNLDGRKVAEGIAPYTDEAMATYINFD